MDEITVQYLEDLEEFLDNKILGQNFLWHEGLWYDVALYNIHLTNDQVIVVPKHKSEEQRELSTPAERVSKS